MFEMGAREQEKAKNGMNKVLIFTRIMEARNNSRFRLPYLYSFICVLFCLSREVFFLRFKSAILSITVIKLADSWTSLFESLATEENNSKAEDKRKENG